MTDKATARAAAFQRRKSADQGVAAAANSHLVQAIRKAPGRVISGYWPIRTEIDPRPALHELAGDYDLCLPVVEGRGQPLTFRRWAPGMALVPGAFGAKIPEIDEKLVPDILIVPLAAFDEAGYRLGYGGGFYDRTLQKLRAVGPRTAIGFAYDIQKCGAVPREATDQRLDLIVTETGLHNPI